MSGDGNKIMNLERFATITMIIAAFAVVVILVTLFIVITYSFIHMAFALPENTTDWDFGGIELWDDDKEEEEEIEDEKEHEEWAKDNE